MRQELTASAMVVFDPDRPGHYIPKAEIRLITSMGRFTLYPDDEFETAHPEFLIVWRNGHDLHIPWGIISTIVPCQEQSPQPALVEHE